MKMHVYIGGHLPQNVTKTLYETMEQFDKRKPLIVTTQTHFISTRVLDAGYRLFVHYGSKMVEIHYGECKATNRYIRRGLNLERLVLAGEFEGIL